MYTFEEYKQEALGNEELHREYEAIQPEYDIIKAIDIISFDIAMDYAEKNRKEGEDFRRELFRKEIEIYSLFGDEYERKKRNEIEKILKRNPYSDDL